MVLVHTAMQHLTVTIGLLYARSNVTLADAQALQQPIAFVHDNVDELSTEIEFLGQLGNDIAQSFLLFEQFLALPGGKRLGLRLYSQTIVFGIKLTQAVNNLIHPEIRRHPLIFRGVAFLQLEIVFLTRNALADVSPRTKFQ